MGVKSKYTESDKEEIRRLCKKGIPDTEISNITGFSYFVVQKTSTKYWKDKMDRKNDKNNEVK